jgi:hypothetical protein
MPHTTNTYTIPFNPILNGPGEFATTKEMFNHHQFEKKRGSRVSPYPSFVSRIVPFGHVFGPLLSSFAASSHDTQSHSARKQQKHQIKQ